MKKFLSIILALVITASLGACGNGGSSSSELISSEPVSSEPVSSEEISSDVNSSEAGEPEVTGTANIAALKGPTAMGLVKLMDDSDSAADSNYNFTIAASADEISPQLIQGNLDIAAVPANLASILYNRTEGEIQVLAVNTLGVLYIVENGNTISSVEDLRGKTIYSSGKGSTPEYALTYMLSQNGIDPAADVTIEWKTEHAECVAAITQGTNAVAMLPQPFVTTAQAQNDQIRVALDLTKEWETISGTSDSPATLITGVVVARREFAENNKALVDAFLSDYQASVEYVTENNDAAAALVGKYEIVPEAVAKKALPQCNITFIAGDEMKEKLSGYLGTLFDQNPEAVGGTLPGDDFYYQK